MTKDVDVDPEPAAAHDGVLVIRAIEQVDGRLLFRITMGTAADEAPTMLAITGADELHATVDRWLAALQE
ncbi:hypothetical protein [Nocardioides donggukensis]|uniref:Uncharacterized protein n=1 Tax=Nocardioides donggukensis TaxID=2774019 RepID=A0A927K6Z3_9ACTN|nr:hypothetical protein [Nocardioides donggukensis]MBD8868840.1 hypothetical protein [Nocardioides donggukensis]